MSDTDQDIQYTHVFDLTSLNDEVGLITIAAAHGTSVLIRPCPTMDMFHMQSMEMWGGGRPWEAEEGFVNELYQQAVYKRRTILMIYQLSRNGELRSDAARRTSRVVIGVDSNMDSAIYLKNRDVDTSKVALVPPPIHVALPRQVLIRCAVDMGVERSKRGQNDQG